MIKVEIDDREVMGALRRLKAAGADLSSAMADIAQALASESERQLQREAGPGRIHQGRSRQARQVAGEETAHYWGRYPFSFDSPHFRSPKKQGPPKRPRALQSKP